MSTLLYNRILIIDDNPAIHEDFRKIFNKIPDQMENFDEDELALFGETSTQEIIPFFEVDTASQGQEGFEKIKAAYESKEPYCVAFVDSRMPPGWDGIETIEHIWQVDPDIQVVICTAYSDYSWEDIIKRLGNTDRLLILKKPFDTVEVRQLASALTKKWHLGQQVRHQLDGLQTIVEQKTEDLNKTISLVRATLDATTDGILVVDLNNKIIDYNQRFATMWDIPNNIVNEKDLNKVKEYLRSAMKEGAIDIPHSSLSSNKGDIEFFDEIELNDGRVFERYFQQQRINGVLVGKVISYRDITRHKQMERELAYQATHDALTGLPNRVILNDRIKQAIALSKRQDNYFAILFIDIDRFKYINDSLGHQVGDLLLQTAATRLKKTVRESDTVVRLGGDEFIIVLTSLPKEDNSIPILNKLLKTITEPFYIEEHEFRLSASIGISLFPQHGEDPDTLLRNADAAMYRAKEYGRNNYQYYSEDMNVRIANRLALENDLHKALERGEFVLHYQPIVDIASGKIVSNEALIRWQHPKLGLVPPQEFISLAEETGFLVPLGEWLLKEACMQNKKWQTLGFAPIAIAVNVSAHQIKQRVLIDTINDALRLSGMDAKYLELEFTESVVIENADKATLIMQELKQKGISLVIDDFGTGYSSLSYLQHFPIDKIKIDRSFVSYINAHTSSNDTAIILAIINIGNALNLKVIAEGVENENQLAFLKEHKCTEIQGFYFSKPLTADEMAEVLKQKKNLLSLASNKN